MFLVLAKIISSYNSLKEAGGSEADFYFLLFLTEENGSYHDAENSENL